MQILKRLRLGIGLLLVCCGLTACQRMFYSSDFEQITAKEAKVVMETKKDFIIIDARSAEEFAKGHIKGAILIPEPEIATRAQKELPNKNALILVYCRSGRRSKMASATLAKLGYINVKEFGGIKDWPYEIVK